MKVCIVSSCGGHLTEVRCLKPAYEVYEYFYVLDDKAMLPADMQGKTYFVSHSERDWKFLLNLWEAFQLLRKEKPDIVLSTGAGLAVPFAIVGRYIFKTRIIFIETIARLNKPSLSGKIMYRLAHEFYYQWKALSQFFPKAKYGGPLL
jgi:UDP-N-acetylglucosamine:LPS N-acetylglucosamine transferase